MRLMIIGILSMFCQLTGFPQDLIINGNFNEINICSESSAPCSFEVWRFTSSLLPKNLAEGNNNFTSITVFNHSATATSESNFIIIEVKTRSEHPY